MKFVKAILVLLLLTPMVGYGQKTKLNFRSISLDKQINELSRKLYILGNTEKVIPFKTATFSNKIKLHERIDLIKDEEVVIQVQDPVWPDEYALIDTLATLKFNIEQIRGIGFCQDSNGLRALIPMRYDYYTYKWRPMFVMKWEKVKAELIPKELELLNFLFDNLDKDIFPVAWKRIEGNNQFSNYEHYENPNGVISEEMISAFGKLYDEHLKGKKPLLFKDSLFKVPAINFKMELCDSARLNFKKPITYYKNVKYRYYKMDIEKNSSLLKVQITRVFSESIKNLGEVDILVRDTFYFKQEDFLPYLPEWLQFLMTDVYIDEK
jgi:hypothetical protein